MIRSYSAFRRRHLQAPDVDWFPLLDVCCVPMVSAKSGPEVGVLLIAETRCSTLLAAEGATSVFDDIRKSRPDLQMLTIPSFDECINTNVHYPYQIEYEVGQHNQILILHTPGATSLHRMTDIGGR